MANQSQKIELRFGDPHSGLAKIFIDDKQVSNVVKVEVTGSPLEMPAVHLSLNAPDLVITGMANVTTENVNNSEV